MEYRHLSAGTEDSHKKSQLNSYGQSQDSNSELHEYKSAALSVLSTGSVYVLQSSNKRRSTEGREGSALLVDRN